MINDTGQPDLVVASAQQHLVQDLPDDVMVFLLGSRYCETDLLSETAWQMFKNAPFGWGRVQTICDFVHNHITFDYAQARATHTAWEAFNERRGVCRDFAHLAVTLCRCMNISARYCTGYLSDIGVPPPMGRWTSPAGSRLIWAGAWHTFEPRNNVPRIGRIPDGTWPRCGRRADQQHVRRQHPDRLQDLDGRDAIMMSVKREPDRVRTQRLRWQSPRARQRRNIKRLLSPNWPAADRLPRLSPRRILVPGYFQVLVPMSCSLFCRPPQGLALPKSRGHCIELTIRWLLIGHHTLPQRRQLGIIDQS